jgi:O-antigen ligase
MREIIFILFLISGILKTISVYLAIYYIDLTMIFALLMLILLVIDIYNTRGIIQINKISLFSIILILLLFIWIIFSTYYKSSTLYVYDKILRFFTIILGFIYPFITKEFSVKKFLKYFVLIVLVISIIYIPLFFNAHMEYNSSKIAKKLFNAYLIVGYLSSIAFFINIFNNLFLPINKFIISFSLFTILILTGARGPLLILLFVLTIHIVTLIHKIKMPNIKVLIFSILILFISIPYISKYVSLDGMIERTYKRLTALENLNKDTASKERLNHIKFVLDKTNISIILTGYGFGSYAQEKISKDVRLYPHNILLEVFFELGLIGLTLFSIFLILIIYELSKHKQFWLFGLFILLFLNSLKSLSIVDSRVMFGLLSIILLTNSKIKE